MLLYKKIVFWGVIYFIGCSFSLSNGFLKKKQLPKKSSIIEKIFPTFSKKKKQGFWGWVAPKNLKLNNFKSTKTRVLAGTAVMAFLYYNRKYIADNVVAPCRKRLIYKACQNKKLFLLKMALCFNKKDYVNERCSRWRTPLQVACDANNHGAIEYLIKSGVSINPGNLFERICKQSNYDIKTVKTLVENGLRLNVNHGKFNIQKTPLCYACEKNDYELIKYLVGQGADVNDSGLPARTPLHIVFDKKNDKAIRFLIDGGADIDAVDKKGKTVSILAYENKDYEKVKFFVEKGANLNKRNKNGDMLLHMAFKEKNYDMLSYLLEKGTNINALGGNGDTLLHIALQQKDYEACDFLIKHGADIDAVNSEQKTLLHIACENDDFQSIQYLIEKGVNINVRCKKYGTILHIACKKGDEKVVTYLIEKGANIGAVCYRYGTLLHVACQNSDYKMIEYLIQKGIDIDVRCNKYGTILHLACKNGNSKMVEYLVQNGANISKEDLDIVYLRGHYEIAKYLACQQNILSDNKDIANKFLFVALEKEDLNFISYLIEHGANINAKNEMGETCLHIAVKKNLPGLVAFLIDNKANMNIIIGRERKTLLYFSCEKGFQNIVKLLLRNGANPNEIKYPKKTLLHVACENNFYTIIEDLIQYGACVNAVVYYKITKYVKVEVRKLKFSYGCSYVVNEEELQPRISYEYKTPLCIACDKKDNRMINIFLKPQKEIIEKNTSILELDEVLKAQAKNIKIAEKSRDIYRKLEAKQTARLIQERIEKLLSERGRVGALREVGNPFNMKKCLISLEEFSEEDDSIYRLQCGHIFYKDYIEKWLEEKNSCPVCRKSVSRGREWLNKEMTSEERIFLLFRNLLDSL